MDNFSSLVLSALASDGSASRRVPKASAAMDDRPSQKVQKRHPEMDGSNARIAVCLTKKLDAEAIATLCRNSDPGSQDEDAPDSTPSESSEAATDVGRLLSTEDWTLDLELMYHYINALYRLGVRKDVVPLWRQYIPQQAFRHPFLLHGILALAALHLAYLRPENSFKYLQTCDKHQGIALEEYRSILELPIEPEVGDSLFALSATLSVSSMARSCTRADSAVSLDMDAITELFILTRGVKNVIQLAYQHIRDWPMAVMLENQPYPGDEEGRLPPIISSNFEAIRSMLVTYGMDEESLYHCQSALTELIRIYKNIAYISSTAGYVEVGDVSRWQVRVSMAYIRLIQARSQPALIILAYYTAAVTAVRKAWFTHSWAKYALRGISQELPGHMHHWIHWPMQQISDRLSELGVRSPNYDSFD